MSRFLKVVIWVVFVAIFASPLAFPEIEGVRSLALVAAWLLMALRWFAVACLFAVRIAAHVGGADQRSKCRKALEDMRNKRTGGTVLFRWVHSIITVVLLALIPLPVTAITYGVTSLLVAFTTAVLLAMPEEDSDAT